MSLADELKKISEESLSRKAENDEKIISDITSYFKEEITSQGFYEYLKRECSNPKIANMREFAICVELLYYHMQDITKFSVAGGYDFYYQGYIPEDDLKEYILKSIVGLLSNQLKDFGFDVESKKTSYRRYECIIKW